MFSLFENPLLRQYAVVITVNLSVLCTGLGLAWPSPVLIALREPTDPVLSRPITENEGSWIVSIGFLVGSIVTFLPGLLLDRIGRKHCVLLAASTKLIVGFLYIFATEPWMLLLGRSIQGASDVFIFSSVPIYASEIASTKIRGALGTILQIMSSIGIVFMLSVGPFVAYNTLNIIYTTIIVIGFIPLLFLPESPYFLYKKGRKDEVVKLLTFLRGTEELAHHELKQYDLSKSDNTLSRREIFRKRTFLKALGLVVVIGIGTQLVGFNAVTFYLQTVLESTQTSVAPEIASVVIGMIQLLASVCSSMVTDRFGRKPILSSTLVGMALGMVGLGTFFFVTEDTEEISGFLNFMPLVSLILVVFCFSGGLGSVIWSLSAELFDGPTRALGMVLSTQTMTLFVFLTTLYFPALTSSIGPAPTYWIFSVNCVLLCAFIVFCVPETKGKTIAEIQEALGAKVVDDNEKSERNGEFK